MTQGVLPPLKKVIIESPFKATQERSQEVHECYLQHCLADSVSRGESPFASHLYLTKVLNDDVPMERAVGIQAGWVWAEHADLIAVYCDLGVSSGMAESIDRYMELGKIVERRTLDDRIVKSVLRF